MNIIIKKIQEDYPNMSETNKLIANAIIESQGNFDLTVKELSDMSYCAQSTVIKFCNALGYNSFKVFKHDLNETTLDTFTTIIKSFELVGSYIKNNQELIQTFIQAINKANKVYIYASSYSQVPALDFYLKVNKFIPNKFIFESELSVQNRTIKSLRADDLSIFISNSGENDELVSLLPQVQENCDNIFLISNRSNSTLSDKIINTINLGNTLESQHNFKEFPQESKYSLLYFLDRIFELLKNNNI